MKREQGRPIVFSAELKEEFCQKLISNASSVRKTCKDCGIDRQTYYNHLDSDPEFKQKVLEAKIKAVETIEDAVLERAVFGVPQGEGALKYSDTLAIFMLKSHKPDKYGDKQQFTHNFDIGKEIRGNKQAIQAMRNLAGQQPVNSDEADNENCTEE